MFGIDEVIKIHEILIDQFGGTNGLRDQGLLESALARPWQTFEGKELYPSAQEKASALLESLAINHPFVDGNKRIAYTLFRLLLLNEGIDIKATQNEKYQLIIAITKGEMKFEHILNWTTSNSVKVA